jgi:hypothetical protein
VFVAELLAFSMFVQAVTLVHVLLNCMYSVPYIHVLLKFIYVLRPGTRCQNLIHKEIKDRLNLGNVCYHPVQELLSFRLLSKNVKIRIKTFFL